MDDRPSFLDQKVVELQYTKVERIPTKQRYNTELKRLREEVSVEANVYGGGVSWKVPCVVPLLTQFDHLRLCPGREREERECGGKF